MTDENAEPKKDLEQLLAESQAEIDKYFETQKRKIAARSPYLSSSAGNPSPRGGAGNPAPTSSAGRGIASGDAREQAFDSQVEGEEGQGIGDLYANQQLAQLNLDAQEGQAKVVGEEATISERRRQIREEESSAIPPKRIGPDKNGRFVPRLEYHVQPMMVNGQPRYTFTVTYGTRIYEGVGNLDGIRDIDRRSLVDLITDKARRLGVYFGNSMSMNFLNPSVSGHDFLMTVKGVYRREILKGAFYGTIVEISTLPVTRERLLGIIAALEPESVSQISKEQEEG